MKKFKNYYWLLIIIIIECVIMLYRYRLYSKGQHSLYNDTSRLSFDIVFHLCTLLFYLPNMLASAIARVTEYQDDDEEIVKYSIILIIFLTVGFLLLKKIIIPITTDIIIYRQDSRVITGIDVDKASKTLKIHYFIFNILIYIYKVLEFMDETIS